MKLFQIEEPDGSPADPNLPGAAIGIDASGAVGEAAFSVGGNAAQLSDHEGFARTFAVPRSTAARTEWRALFEGLRLRAERALARPVTHAAVALRAPLEPDAAAELHTAAAEAGIEILRLLARSELPADGIPVLVAAILAEDLSPGAGTRHPPAAYFR